MHFRGRTSITENRQKLHTPKSDSSQVWTHVRPWAAIFWLLLWEAASLAIGSRLLLVSPVQAVLRLMELLPTGAFWQAVFFSFGRISAGFLAAAAAGILLAALSARFLRVEELLAPPMLVMKSVPVASFIILALIWFSSRNLSVLISFLMVLPVVYTNTLAGIRAADVQLTEMAELFRIPPLRRIRYIYMPQVLPYFQSACGISLGLCWKSGIAAEVIGMPQGSIGERLQQAKVYLDTPDLFAWTFVIVLVSLSFERLVLAGLRFGAQALRQDRMGNQKNEMKEVVCGKEKQNEGEERQPENDRTNGKREMTEPIYAKKTAAVSLRGICKTYGNNCVLNRLDLDFPCGRTTAVMAPSGSGKTTLLRILMGFETADSGTISGLSGMRPAAVFQEDRLCSELDAAANIRLVNPAHTRRAVGKEMEKLGLCGCMDQQVSEFSGGMRRRTALLRALLSDYDILFLDEPFKGLDEELKQQTIDYVKKQSRGKTVLLVTHDEKEANALGAEICRI